MIQKKMNAMKDVIDTLEKVLTTEFPDCKAFPYGSSASGLGFRDCDLDIYVDLALVGIWDDRFKTMKVSNILQREERFKSAEPIINVRTPIIRLTEGKTGIKGDINVVSRMGVKNTEYIAWCREQDPRFLPLMSILKYFSSKQEITGSGMGDHLNSYTLVLMVIFFLQSNHILHSVETLQEGVEKDEVDGWNVTFCRDKSQLPQLEPNRSTVLELLSDFFKFYRDFPFETQVICPLFGQPIRKQIFLHSSLETAKLEVDKVLVVQDPFVLTKNTGQGVSHGRLVHMVDVFSTAKHLLEDIKTEKEVKFWMLFEPGLCSYCWL